MNLKQFDLYGWNAMNLKQFDLYGWNALKGQKLLAQGNALGIKAVSKSPCKGKSFTNCLEF